MKGAYNYTRSISLRDQAEKETPSNKSFTFIPWTYSSNLLQKQNNPAFRKKPKNKLKTTKAIIILKPILEPDKILKIILCPSLLPLF